MPSPCLACPSPEAGNPEFQPGGLANGAFSLPQGGRANPTFGLSRGSCQCAVWPAPGGRAKPLVWVAQGVVPILPLACPSPNAGNREFQPGFAYPAFGMPQGLCQSCLWLVPALPLEIASSSQDLLILPLACPKGCANPAFGLSQGVLPMCRLACPSRSRANPTFALLHGLCYSCFWPAPRVVPILPLACPKGCANAAFGLSQP